MLVTPTVPPCASTSFRTIASPRPLPPVLRAPSSDARGDHHRIDHTLAGLALVTRALDGHREGLTRHDVVENISLYWLTNTAISAARPYWESSTR